MILNIETTTEVGSVSLTVNGNCLILREDLETGDHARNMTLFIEEILYLTNTDRKSIQAVAISSGPGSYTGLRIGLSLAKGLCFALKVPLLAVPTLKTLAYAVNCNYKLKKNDRIVSLQDARRMDAYAAVFDCCLNEIKATHFLTLEPDSFEEIMVNNAEIYICGNASEKFKSLIADSNIIFTKVKHPSSIYMERLSFELFKASKFEDLAYFEPFYLKAPNITKPKSVL